METQVYNHYLESGTDEREEQFLNRAGEVNAITKIRTSKGYSDVFEKVPTPFTIKYACNGMSYYEFDNLTVSSSPFQVVIIPPAKPYTSFLDTKEQSVCLNLFFSDSLIQDLFNPSVFVEDNEPIALQNFLDQKKIMPLTDKMKELLNRIDAVVEKGMAKNEELFGLMSGLLLKTFDKYEQIWEQVLSYSAAKLSTKVEVSKRLYRVKDYIHCHYQDEIDIEQLATIAYMNQYYLIRKFKTFFGITPYQMLLRRRVEVAKARIVTSQEPITSIASETGFNNLPNFYAAFKNRYHTLPGDLRS